MKSILDLLTRTWLLAEGMGGVSSGGMIPNMAQLQEIQRQRESFQNLELQAGQVASGHVRADNRFTDADSFDRSIVSRLGSDFDVERAHQLLAEGNMPELAHLVQEAAQQQIERLDQSLAGFRDAVAAHPEGFDFSDTSLRRELLRDPGTSADVLRQMAPSILSDTSASAEWTAAGLANHPNAPPELLEQLAQHPHSLVRGAVASRWDPPAPAAALAQLAGDTDPGIRRSVAGNPGTPPEALAQLAGDQNHDVLVTLARNPNTPPEALAQLAQLAGDSNHGIRVWVAMHHNAPPEALTALASDPDATIRSNVAHNPNTPQAVLGMLASDPRESVRNAASRGSVLDDLEDRPLIQ